MLHDLSQTALESGRNEQDGGGAAGLTAEPTTRRRPGRPRGHPKTGGRVAGGRLGAEARLFLAAKSDYLATIARLAKGQRVRIAQGKGHKPTWYSPTIADIKWALEIVVSRLLPVLSAQELSVDQRIESRTGDVQDAELGRWLALLNERNTDGATPAAAAARIAAQSRDTSATGDATARGTSGAPRGNGAGADFSATPPRPPLFDSETAVAETPLLFAKIPADSPSVHGADNTTAPESEAKEPPSELVPGALMRFTGSDWLIAAEVNPERPASHVCRVHKRNSLGGPGAEFTAGPLAQCLKFVAKKSGGSLPKWKIESPVNSSVASFNRPPTAVHS